MSRFVRRLRPPFWVALVGLVVAITALTGTTIGGLAWLEQRATSRTIVDAAMAQAARLSASHAARFLHDAESAARIGPQLVAQGQLDPSDDTGLERFVLATLYAHPHLTWVSYSDRDDRFVGAWRDAAGQVYLNRSFPAGDRIHLVEEAILVDGRRKTVRRSSDHGYRPTERPHFRLARERKTVGWTEPYEFYASGGLGITCAAPLLDAGGDVRGVFTVDFSLARLGDFLQAVEASPGGRAFIATRQGTLLVGSRGHAGSSEDGLDADLVAAAARRAALASDDAAFEFEHAGARYLGRAVPLAVGELPWLVEVVVPEADFLAPANAQGRQTVLIAVLAILMAAACGVKLARWIARPIRELAEQARLVREGRRDVTIVPQSRDEIGVLARAMNDMVRAMRDRDFIRETLGRYVSPEIAERCLRDRQALRLGGELRRVTILMSDLRGFSELSERLGPEAMITILNRYYARMAPVILAHGGMIDEFIGDAILVLFGAPFERPDDSERAVRCAVAMQRTLAELNEEHRRLGLPELAMGIGIHAGKVVAGNIGSEEHVKYGVVGPAVNAAARIQALCAGGEVLVSEAVRAATGRVARFGQPQHAWLKGSTAPMTVWRVV
ncbi:MAG TPA: adenylate/guanylate cyclase domain-containing protein, partial [Candidatus Tectomicrobia bacterium]|nr:adenylate/guanylate cyclase domain-containing protein [Candidatus Tectomicrobia bacterium]